MTKTELLGWNNGQGRASDSLHLVCFGWPSDSRRLTERDLMGDGVGLDLSARIAVTDFLRYSSPLSEQADRAAYDAQATRLAGLFRQNFEQFRDKVHAAVGEAGPR